MFIYSDLLTCDKITVQWSIALQKKSALPNIPCQIIIIKIDSPQNGVLMKDSTFYDNISYIGANIRKYEVIAGCIQ